ncbi:MAG: hypothetical protein CFE44_02640 [Burkholderiales bacterium PBB4]|nr:MAG: hypothetical protein CFE44_02640 [Burkholderiales bacterium PBB4]
MKRQWMRLVRRKGWLYFGAPIVATIALFVFLQQAIDEYVVAADSASDVSLRLETIALAKYHLPKLRELEGYYRPQSEAVLGRAFVGSNANESLTQFVAELNQILRSLYFDEIEVVQKPVLVEGNQVLQVSASFSGVPQQLNRLESALATNMHAIRVNQLDVLAENNAIAGTGSLRVKVGFVALHAQIANAPTVLNNVGSTK